MRDGEEGEGCLRSQFREWNRFWAERVGGEKKGKRKKEETNGTKHRRRNSDQMIRNIFQTHKPVSAQMASVHIDIYTRYKLILDGI